MKRRLLVVFVLAVSVFAAAQHQHRSSGSGMSGTGSKSSSEGVHGYVKRNGTYVAPYHRTTRDSTQLNNYETKRNYNPYTSKVGKKPASH
jgi:hypothetical protein